MACAPCSARRGIRYHVMLNGRSIANYASKPTAEAVAGRYAGATVEEVKPAAKTTTKTTTAPPPPGGAPPR